MTQHDHLRRRRFLKATGSTALMSLAGCLGAPVGANTQAPTPADHHDNAGHHEASSAGSHGDGHHEEAAPHGDDGHHAHSPTEYKSGHGHSHDETVSSPTDATSVRMTTSLAGTHFEPHVTWIEIGGSVTFVNASGSHTATAYHPAYDRPLLMPEGAEPFDSGLLTEAGEEFAHTFETPGVYHVFCEPHEAVGMLGSVIVGEPDPHDQPALGEIPSSLPATAQEKIEHLNAKVNEALGHEH